MSKFYAVPIHSEVFQLQASTITEFTQLQTHEGTILFIDWFIIIIKYTINVKFLGIVGK